jgi:glycosyltransferase involved in cell wall biosynthesis
MRVTLYSSWQTRCGISDYNQQLVTALPDDVTVEIVREPLAPRGVRQDWPLYYRLGEAMNQGELGHIHHAHSFWGGRSPLRNSFPLFWLRIRVPVVATIHDVFGERIHGWQVVPEGQRGRGARRLAWEVAAWGQACWWRRALPRFRRLIVHSASQREALLRAGARGEQVVVVPHMIRSVAVAERAQARAALGVADDEVLLTLFGFPGARKGFDVALAALAQLPPRMRLILAGGATLPTHEAELAALQARAVALGVQDRFKITGYLADEALATIWGATDIVLAPFRESTGSGSLATAIGAGQVIIASDLPQHREINGYHRALHLVAPDAASALAAAIERVAGNAGDREELRRGAIAYREAFSVAATAGRLVGLYREVLG